MKTIRLSSSLSGETGNIYEDLDKLAESHLDVTGAGLVQVISNLGVDGQQVLHVNVNGICLLRICRIEELHLAGQIYRTPNPLTPRSA